MRQLAKAYRAGLVAARILSERDLLGLRRQIFFLSMGGCDTHANALASHRTLFSQLDAALTAFYNSTAGPGQLPDDNLGFLP